MSFVPELHSKSWTIIGVAADANDVGRLAVLPVVQGGLQGIASVSAR